MGYLLKTKTVTVATASGQRLLADQFEELELRRGTAAAVPGRPRLLLRNGEQLNFVTEAVLRHSRTGERFTIVEDW